MQAKSLLQSSTIKNASLTGVLVLLASLTPTLSQAALQYFPNQAGNIQTAVQVLNIVYALMGVTTTGGAIAGRMKVGDVYTPDWMPGRNQSDIGGTDGNA